MNKPNCSIILFFFLLSFSGHAQKIYTNALPFRDMSSFKPQSGNWQVVKKVSMDPTVNTHEEHKPAEQTTSKKKKSKGEQPISKTQAVSFEPGTGILLNINSETQKTNLITNWEHGDIDLEFEVMLPKGSNSGIYLQGRYEVQLYDSWGVKRPSFSDIGGIYRNWESTPDSIYMGKVPLSNPSKAPGLWQKLSISFRAPKFDAQGKKTANAKFVLVKLNDVVIHENVEVPLPTGGPISKVESPTGPLMIQGDHGPVAIRNFRYTLIKEIPITLGELSYKAYHGNFKTIADIDAAKPVSTGTVPELTYEVANKEDMYAVHFTTTVTVPEDNKYLFELGYAGGARLIVNGKQLTDYQRPDAERNDTASIFLRAGTYPVEIYNYKDVSWEPPKLALFVKTANSFAHAFHTFNSYPPDEVPTSSILVNPGNSTRLLRAFVDFKGDRGRRLTHVIGVGDPNGIHYVYDMKSANLVCVWRGNFVDATPMWHDRGDGSFVPNGAPQFLFTNQPLAFLTDANEAFPSRGYEAAALGKGYDIEENTGRPVFKYQYEGLEVQDKVYPEDSSRSITHEVILKDRGSKKGLYYKVAEGSSVMMVKKDLYVIDQEFYIKGDLPFTIRNINGKQELVASFDQNAIKYTIIW
jgi:hypothetical protein